MRHGQEPDAQIECRVKGEIEPLMDSKVLVDMDSIFDDGTFENARKPMIILVEGALGSGKTSLAYHYCQKWAEGNLSMFDVVALVYLRHPAVHSAGLDLTLHQLLLLACASDDSQIIDGIIREIVQCVDRDLKLLLILDGWDEALACLRNLPDPLCPPDNSFLGKLLRSVSSNTTILITSRPDSSLDLHNRANVNRVEILGFTKESIHDYFQEALSTQLSSDQVQHGIARLRDHFRKFPAIESSCYIPLNAAILILVYLEHNRTLPTTHYELLYQLLLCCINREIKTRESKQISTISSLDDLPHDLKKFFYAICLLAYKGIVKNKVVFTQDDLPSILPTPAREDLPAMGVLQRVQWYSTSSKILCYNFIHLSVQELLAAYCISKLEESEQVRVFEYFERIPIWHKSIPALLLENFTGGGFDHGEPPRFYAILQFYAGFTKLANEGVRNIITRRHFTIYRLCKLILLNYMRCIFEAQVCDQLFYQRIIVNLRKKIDLFNVTMAPFDCVAFGYFLAFALRSTNELSIVLSHCGIDDHSMCILMEELSKHTKPSQEGCVLHGVIELDISGCMIGDIGIARVSTALQKNTTMTTLNISGCGISYVGAESLSRALAFNVSLQDLDLHVNKIGDEGIAHIANALQKNTSLRILNVSSSDISDAGAESLAIALTVNRSLQKLNICLNKISDTGIAHIATALQTNCILNTLECGSSEPETITDKGAVLILSTLTTNRSLECLKLGWTSAHPDSTLKKIGDEEYVSKSTLKTLELNIHRPQPSDDGPTVEQIKEWLQNVEVGGKAFMYAQIENSELTFWCLCM